MSTVAWLASTAILFVICVFVVNFLEAFIHRYGARVVAMLFAGVAIGALASAVGYGFFILAVMLALYLWRMRGKLVVASGSSEVANRYILPAIILVVAATLASSVFSLESCEQIGKECKRVFFERIYTPPHLLPRQ
ncbi:MAG: hypothetical protein CFE46_10755 [Burkholderiales bacterium PBB6]|nr:MAG: hypothetical protein CFE46_10755 [Burkholderiales bacterium PBB6]